MYNICYKLYFLLMRLNKRKKEKNGEELKIINTLIGYIEAYYNLIIVKKYRKTENQKKGINIKPRDEKIIISLTSFPKRINTVWITVETLLRQTIKPDMIILWLAKSQFTKLEELPSNLLKLQERGLTIRFCDDLKSHKKYYYTMKEFPNDLIILADDDMFYPKDTVKKLLDMHKKYPNDICCITGQVMNTKLLPSQWRNPKLNENTYHCDNIQIFTGSGSLFPPKSLDSNALNIDLIQELCLYADDLWLTYMAYKKGTKVSCLTPWRAFPITIYGTAQNSLWFINAEQGKNDLQWKNINEFFN